jgi:hypothetical protein
MKPSKKISAIQWCGTKLDIDADKDWKRLLEESPEEQVAAIAWDLHFLIHLGWMDLPHAIKTRFFSEYTKPAAIKTRGVAIDGLIASNYDNEMDLVTSAAQFHRDRHAGRYKDRLEDAHCDAVLIAARMGEIVAGRDVAALRRMIAILESRGLPQGDRGGISSEDGYMFRKFCELHIQTRSLPTKKQLREACGLGDRSWEKLASKRMRKLGLWGLPTEPEI